MAKKQDPEISRRNFVTGALGVTAGVTGISLLSSLGSLKPVNIITPEKEPVAKGDTLVFAEGPNKDKPIDLGALTEKPERAFPKGEVVKAGEPNNLLLVYKFPKGQLAEPTKLDATIDGEVVVYSAICTHLGCQVNHQDSDGSLLCPCHSGNYDPKHGCKVIGGPPPRPLAQLPVKLDKGNIVVAGEFLSLPYGAEG